MFGGSVVIIALISSYFLISERKFKENKDSDINSAYVLSEAGKGSEATVLMEERYSRDKNDEKIAKLLSTLYFQNKQYSKFKDLVASANISDSGTYTMLAYISRAEGNQEETIGYYNKAIELSPQGISVYVNLANYYQILGQIDKAMEIVKNGLNINPRSTNLNILAANFALTLGDKNAAKEYARKVLELDKNNQRAKTILNNLSKK